MKTVIMAGGKGSRISAVASDIPKPMIPIGGRPVLERELECLRKQGFTDFIFTVSHMSEQIMEYFGDGSGISPATGEPFGVNIQYFIEEQPLGNAGALFHLKDQLTEDFLLLNGDTVFDVDFNRMVQFHREHQALVTLFTHPNSHPYDSGLLLADENKAVQTWLTKEEERPEFYQNRVNAGLHVISPKIFDRLKIDPANIGTIDTDTGKIQKVDLDRQLLKPLAGSGTMFCYDSPEYVRDMGTPERFLQVQRDVEQGLSAARNLVQPQKAVFLDRDGTINQYVSFLRKAEDFTLLPGVAEAIRRINQSGYLCIVITNQPVLARGEVTKEQLQTIHNKMETFLGFDGAYVDAIYYCPHHPDKGFPGEIPEWKIDCSCRKPKPGMLLKAAEEFHIDLSESWMVGDSRIDVEAGRNAGCKTAQIQRETTETYGADKCVSDLLEFVNECL